MSRVLERLTPARRALPLHRWRDSEWSPLQRAILITVLAIAMGCLFLVTSLTLGDPVPRHIDAALVGERSIDASPVEAVEQVADRSLAFHAYRSPRPRCTRGGRSNRLNPQRRRASSAIEFLLPGAGQLNYQVDGRCEYDRPE